jgi:LEA14-like dessication related protein
MIHRTIVSLVVLVAVSLAPAGCESVQGMLGDKPSARVAGVRFGDLSLDGITLLFDVEASNPYAVDVPLVDITYGLASGGAAFLNGDAKLDGVIPAKGKRTLELPARINFARLFDAAKGVRPGDVVPYAADLALGVDVPGLGRQSLPLKKQGQLPVPAVPEIKVANISIDKLDMTEAVATVHLDVVNTNRFGLDLNALNYELALGGSTLAKSRLAQRASFAPGGSAKIDVPLSFSPMSAGMAALDVLRGRSAGYTIKGVMDAGTPFGPIKLPYQASGTTPLSR